MRLSSWNFIPGLALSGEGGELNTPCVNGHLKKYRSNSGIMAHIDLGACDVGYRVLTECAKRCQVSNRFIDIVGMRRGEGLNRG